MRKKKSLHAQFCAITASCMTSVMMIEIDREISFSFFSCIYFLVIRDEFVFPSVGLTFKILCTVPYLFHVRGLNGWFHLSVAVSVAVFHVAVRFSNG